MSWLQRLARINVRMNKGYNVVEMIRFWPMHLVENSVLNFDIKLKKNKFQK
jgi:hypothetical protein